MTPESGSRGRRAPSVSSDSDESARLALSELLAANPASILFVDWHAPREWAAVKRERARGIAAMHRMAELRFKAATGRTIGEEILERRLAVACDLLRAGRNSVAAVAGLCGWNGDAAFRKAFASRFGVPPLRWARGHRSASPETAATGRPRVRLRKESKTNRAENLQFAKNPPKLCFCFGRGI